MVDHTDNSPKLAFPGSQTVFKSPGFSCRADDQGHGGHTWLGFRVWGSGFF